MQTATTKENRGAEEKCKDGIEMEDVLYITKRGKQNMHIKATLSHHNNVNNKLDTI